MFVLHRHLWIVEWSVTEAGNIKFIVCSVECVCKSICIYAEGSMKTSQSYLDQTSSKQCIVLMLFMHVCM